MGLENLLNGIDPELLSTFGAVPAPVPTTDPVRAYQTKKKKRSPARAKHAVHTTFADQLRDDVLWFNEKLLHIPDLVTKKISVSLQHQLLEWGYKFPMAGFSYQNCEMDMMALIDDRLIEFEIKSSRKDYARDFKKCVYVGRAMNKHGLIKAGKFITSQFYFVCIPGLIDEDHLPDYAGLIYFHDNVEPRHFFKFEIVKPAPQLHSNNVSPNFYKTLSDRLFTRYMQLVTRYKTSSILNFLSNATPEENNTEDFPADTRKDDAG